MKGDISVDTVARMIGFYSLGSFGAAFLKRMGLSPGEFHRRNRRTTPLHGNRDDRRNVKLSRGWSNVRSPSWEPRWPMRA
ncbi:hypothetical protein [Dongia sedimenti]|uniref:HTH araC/xylS-type domain-containing protein n=1 Tax=Dongia sedimenti TaxID=3064282 RepID=A0ABU0YWP9_9PROT|nr:hypothetical protein [Rhodospirillaceae bacterium R-7]